MKQYLFYTPEGYTESSTGIKTENFQILGFVFAEDVEKARSLLLDENPWIEEAGYSLEEIVVREVSAPIA
ncbi:MAG: hypothetical protein PUG09_00275 [Prevotella sp.]|nr:hypothetical protein [Prevotella sp.]